MKGDNPLGTENVTNNTEWFVNTGTLKAAVECMFFQKKRYIKITNKDFKQKCEAWDFNSDNDKVKMHKTLSKFW